MTMMIEEQVGPKKNNKNNHKSNEIERNNKTQKKENRIFIKKKKNRIFMKSNQKKRADWMPMNGQKASQTRPQPGIVRVCREEEETQTR